MSEQSMFLSRALVGTGLLDSGRLSDLLLSVHPGDLDAPYSTVLALMGKAHMAKEAIEPWTIQTKLAQIYAGIPEDFVTQCSTFGNPEAYDHYLFQFREGLARRKLHETAGLITEAAGAADLRMGFAKVREQLDYAEAVLEPQPVPLIDGDVLWDYVAPPESVLLPGLLWRQGRVIITGHEGGGKSIVLRQLAMAGALGLHPFKPLGTIDPVRTLYVDLENPAALAQSVMRSMLDTLKARRIVREQASFEGRFEFLIRDGLDIVGKGADREYLTGAIHQHKPDLMCVGPVYRLAAGGGDLDEAAVSGVIDYLNHLRTTYDMAIVTEAHPPHGASDSNDGNARRVLRPSGSSAWMRFPEVGRGLRYNLEKSRALGRPVFKFEDWRGDRSPQMRFPRWVAQAMGDQVWYDDCTEEVDALRSAS